MPFKRHHTQPLQFHERSVAEQSDQRLFWVHKFAHLFLWSFFKGGDWFVERGKAARAFHMESDQSEKK